jgi:hypothetical protein
MVYLTYQLLRSHLPWYRSVPIVLPALTRAAFNEGVQDS